MRTSEAGNRGLTLLELLVVVAIMALATAAVGLALRDTAGAQLEREAQRLALLLESARAQSRMSAMPIRWRPAGQGFAFEGQTGPTLPANWLGTDVQVRPTTTVVLGPEAVIGPQQIRLQSLTEPQQSLLVATDGVRPFAVFADTATAPLPP